MTAENHGMRTYSDQHAEDVAHDAGVLCAQTVTGDHGLRYEAGVWRCVHCNATLRLGVWYPAHNDGSIADG